jgi:pyruvate formate lyase activating enzyme
MRAQPDILVVDSRCIACGECREACPLAEALPGTGPLPTRVPDCLQCAACVDACPTDARHQVGQQHSVNEILQKVLKDRVFYEQSGGGVTVSGGEPLSQPAFLIALLRACREQGLHTVLDTTGLGQAEHLLAAAALSHLVLYDLKAFDANLHRRLTGATNRTILRNLEVLSRVHPGIWIRLPVVPGFNDDLEDLSKMAEFVATLKGIQQVSLLPFHRTGLHKWKRLGLSHTLHDVAPPSAERLESIRSLFAGRGLTVRLGN